MNRREAIKRTSLLMGGAISASAMFGVLNGCKPDRAAAGWAPEFFSAEEGDLVAQIAERIMPRTDTPGAMDAGVHTFIDKMMKDFYADDDRKPFHDWVKKVDADANAANGKNFLRLTPEQQDALLTQYDQAAADQRKAAEGQPPQPGAKPHPFQMMKELTLLGFFTSEIGANEFLRYEAVPGGYQGCIPYSEVGRAWAT